MKSIEEVYRDFPDEAREKVVVPAPPPAPPSRKAILAACVLAVVVLAAVSPFEFGSTGCSRAHWNETLVAQIEGALACYQVRHGGFPSGDGKGSGELVRALRSTVDANGRTQTATFEPGDEFVDPNGNLINFHGKPFHYLCPGVHNPGSYDLWSEDGRGDPAGVRNW